MVRWELAAYVALILGALVMRLWGLGERPLAHDEVLHAWFSWQLFQGEGYIHAPLMHGTFLVHVTALGYFLFGDSLLTTRVMPALFGTALVGLPFFLRSYLGRTGALMASLLLATSPILLYYSRYIRNDIFMAVWTMALVVCMWRYLESGRHRYLYLTALVLALALATKETTFILIAILGVYVFLRGLDDVEDWVRRRVPLSRVSRPAVFFLVLLTLTLPQWSAGLAVLQDLLPVTLAIRGDNLSQVGLPEGAGLYVAGVVVVLLLAVSTAWGLRWNWRVWIRSAVIFYVVWTLLYTTFLTNILGIGTGFWQSLGYWLAQQDVARGNQPWYYYFVLMPIYETLPFLLMFVASGYYLWRRPGGVRWTTLAMVLGGALALIVGYVVGGTATRMFGYVGMAVFLAAVVVPITVEPEVDAFPRFLVYWTVATFAAYTLAGEKMPWLLVNIAVPAILLASRFLGELVDRIPWREVARRGGLLLLGGIPLLLYFAARPLFLPLTETTALPFWGSVVAALVLVGLGGYLIVRVRVRHGIALVMLGVAGVLFLFGFRTALGATYGETDMGREMLVYAHGDPASMSMVRQIDRLAASSGKGKDLKVAVDNKMYWTWVWYLRNYEKAEFICMDSPDCQIPKDADVVLVQDSEQSQVLPQLEGFQGPQEALRLWWFPEVYRDVSLGDLRRGLVDRRQRQAVMDFLLYRKLEPDALPAEHMFLYYRLGTEP